MASQLVNHTQRRLRNCADRLKLLYDVSNNLHSSLDAQEALGSTGPLPMAELRERGIIATRQLAKRQITWLRSMPQRQVVTADQPDAIAAVQTQVNRDRKSVV